MKILYGKLQVPHSDLHIPYAPAAQNRPHAPHGLLQKPKMVALSDLQAPRID